MTHRERVLKQLADGTWHTRMDLGVPLGSVRVLYAMAAESLVRCRKARSHYNGGNPAWEFQLGPARTRDERECLAYMIEAMEKSRARNRVACRKRSIKQASERGEAPVRMRRVPETTTMQSLDRGMSINEHMALMYATAGRKAPRAMV